MANTNSIDLESSSSQYLSITDGDQTGLDITGDKSFSIELCFKAESFSVDSFLINKNSYFLRVDNSGESVNLTKENVVDQRVSFSFSTGTWYHYAAVQSPTEVEYFIDGSSIGSYENSDDYATISARSFVIGGNWDGLIDEVRVWNDVRTATEISDNYQKELVGDEAGLVAYWKLNNSLLDETSNDNDLTNNNSATFSSDVPFTGASGPANLKSINGLAKASIKSRNGLAIASIKSINGLE